MNHKIIAWKLAAAVLAGLMVSGVAQAESNEKKVENDQEAVVMRAHAFIAEALTVGVTIGTKQMKINKYAGDKCESLIEFEYDSSFCAKKEYGGRCYSDVTRRIVGLPSMGKTGITKIENPNPTQVLLTGKFQLYNVGSQKSPEATDGIRLTFADPDTARRVTNAFNKIWEVCKAQDKGNEFD